jgi:quinol monooxygenase YgiN
MSILRRAVLAAVFAALVAGPAMAGLGDDDIKAKGIVVVTHLDIIPTFVDQARPVLNNFVDESRHDPGVVVFKMISWDPTTNHFQLIEVFESENAYNDHISAVHTILFRRDIQQFIGAPYDERLYEYTNQSGPITP